MTEPTPVVPPRPRKRLRRRVMQGLLILCGVAAVWVYEINAFSLAARADGNRRDLAFVTDWPKEAYERPLQQARDPRGAEALVPDEDSVTYLLVGAAPRQVLRQVFHVTLRHGPRRWRRQMAVTWDEQPAPHLAFGAVVPTGGERLGRDAALAWYDGWLARERAWRRDNAGRLQALIISLSFVGGTYARVSHGWSLTPDSLMLYHQQLASIYRFGEDGVQALVDCLDDAKPTSTRVMVDSADQGPLPAGTICYDVLKDLVELDGGFEEGEVRRFTNAYGTRTWEWPGDMEKPADAARLAAGEAAWRRRLARGEYHYLRAYNITTD